MFMLLSSTPSVTTLDTLKTVFTQVVAWLIEFVRTIATEPLLLVGVAIVFVGLVVGLAFKVIRGKGRRGG